VYRSHPRQHRALREEDIAHLTEGVENALPFRKAASLPSWLQTRARPPATTSLTPKET
jgi:hypothetical protein